MKRILFLAVLILGFCLGGPAKAWPDYDSAIRGRYDSATQDLRDGNYEATFRRMLALAKDGLPKAQFVVGVMYCANLGVQQNFSESFKWFQRASEQGHIKSQYYLGVMFREGKGVLKDDKSALEWFLSSGRQGFAPAQHYLGLVYEKGVGVEIDYVRSGKWFYQGAQSMKSLNRDAHRGNAESQYHLGLLLVEMKKKQDNLAKGLHWMVRAEENGYIEAKLERLWVESRFTEQMKRERKLIAKTYFSLGLFFETEWKGGNNVGLALKWLGYAEKVGYPYAKYKAWLVRGRHEGLPEFYLQTVQWYLDLLTQGNKKISKTVVNKIVPEPVKVGVKVSASSYMNPKANRGFSQLWYSRVPFQSPEWLQADYIKPVRLQRFGFQAQADGPDFSSHKRAPKVFQLIASNDQKIWEVLLSVDDAEFEGSFQGLWKIWSFENYKFFKHYRFIMYANNGDPGLLSVQSWSLAE